MKKGKKKEKILPFSNGYYPKFKDDFWPLFTASISFFFLDKILYHSGFAFSSFNGVLVLLCVIFLSCVCCPRLCSLGGRLLLAGVFCNWYRI